MVTSWLTSGAMTAVLQLLTALCMTFGSDSRTYGCPEAEGRLLTWKLALTSAVAPALSWFKRHCSASRSRRFWMASAV